MVAAAIVGSAAIGAIATNVASNRASGTLQGGETAGINTIQGATGQGVNAVTGAQNKGSNAINSAYSGVSKDLSPYTKLGASSANTLKSILTGGPNALKTLDSLPGYKFQLQQGDQGTINALSAEGLNLSGNAAEGLSQYNQGLASTYAQNYIGDLSSAAGLGLNSATTGANLSAQQGNTLAGLYENTGTNLASLYSGQGSSVAGLISGGASDQANIATANAASLSGIANNASSDFLLNKLMTQQSDYYEDISRWEDVQR